MPSEVSIFVVLFPEQDSVVANQYFLEKLVASVCKFFLLLRVVVNT